MNNLLYNFKQNCFEELDTATELKRDCDFGESFGIKITCATREKIFKTALIILRHLRDSNYNAVTELMPLFCKRVKLHLYQLKKADQYNTENSKVYFLDIIKFFYTCCFKLKDIKFNSMEAANLEI